MNGAAAAGPAEAFLLQERGIFWWADGKLPPTKFAPASAIGGELRITIEGRITVDLDGFLTPGSRPSSALGTSDDPLLRIRKIQGLLRQSNKRVLLSDLSRRGGRFASANVSFEGFMALHCLVGDRNFPNSKEQFSSWVLKRPIGQGPTQSNGMCLAEFSVYSNLKPCASTDRIVDSPQVTSCGPGPVSLPGAFISCGYFPGGLVGPMIALAQALTLPTISTPHWPRSGAISYAGGNPDPPYSEVT